MTPEAGASPDPGSGGPSPDAPPLSTPPPSGVARRGAVSTVGQVVAILVAAVAGALSLFLALAVLSSLLGDARSDPHGYTLIFGSMMLVPASVVGAFALSFVARRDQVRARRWTSWGALAWVVAALALAGYALFSG